jgi:hypothetical protein
MLKKIRSYFAKKEEYIENYINYIDAHDEVAIEYYFINYPGFPDKIYVLPNDILIKRSENIDIINEIFSIQNFGGNRCADDVEYMIMAPIKKLAEIVHLLPGSENWFFSKPGGLFTHCLMTGLNATVIANRTTFEMDLCRIKCSRDENEDLWRYGAFLSGLFCEATKIIPKLSVEINGEQWNPIDEIFSYWLSRNNANQYKVRWNYGNKESILMKHAQYLLINDIRQLDIMTKGEATIFCGVNSVILGLDGFRNPFLKINDEAYKISIEKWKMKLGNY